MPCLLIPGRSGHPLRATSPQESARIAHALVRAGCVPGDRVAVQADKHWHVLALYLACLRAGLVYLPLNTGYQQAASCSIFFDDATPRVIVCRPETLGMVATLRARRDGADARRDDGGELPIARAASRREFDTVHSRPGRSRGHPVHVGHDRPLEGRVADASQPRVERAGAGRGVGVHARRRAAACAADLPRARAFRRDPLRAAVRRAPALAAEIRRAARSSRCCRAATVMMGVPTFYTRLARRAVVHARRLPQRAPVHFRIGAAAAPRRSTRFASAPGKRSSSAMA